jgi:hypothetical protein
LQDNGFSEEVCPREDEGPSNDECCGQEEVVGLDESPLGCEAKGESIVESLNVRVRRLGYSRPPYQDRKLFETRRPMPEDELSRSIPTSSEISKRWRWQGTIV